MMQGLGFGYDFKPYVHPIYNAIMSRLTNQDQDQVRRVSLIFPPPVMFLLRLVELKRFFEITLINVMFFSCFPSFLGG